MGIGEGAVLRLRNLTRDPGRKAAPLALVTCAHRP